MNIRLFSLCLIFIVFISCEDNTSDGSSVETASHIDGQLRGIDNSSYIEDNGFNVVNCSSDGNVILAASAHSHIYISLNGGVQWFIVDGLGKEYWTGVAVSNDGKRMSVTGENLYVTEDSGETWTVYPFGSLYDGEALVSMSDDGSLILMARVHRINDIFISTDYGQTWDSGTIGSDISSLYVSKTGELIAVLARDDDVVLSIDKGQSWTECGFDQDQWLDFAGSSDGRYLLTTNFSAIKFESEDKSEIMISEDYGDSWSSRIIDGIKPLSCQPAISDDGDSMIVASNIADSPFMLTRDGGTTWSSLSPPSDVEDTNWPTFHFCFSSDGERIIAMEEEGSVWTYSDAEGWIRQLNGYSSDQ